MQWQQFWVGSLESLTASFGFLFLVLFLFKPKIKISPHICKGRLIESDPSDYYFIKIINYSLFSAYDIKFELIQVER